MNRYAGPALALVCWACSASTMDGKNAGSETSAGDPVSHADGTVTIVGTVQWYSFEGGFWAIRGPDDTTYDPSSSLDVRWQKPDLPVRATVRVRNDLASTRGVVPIVDILQIEQLSCFGLPCPAPAPALTVIVAGNNPTDVRAVPVLDAMLSNVRRPSGAGVTPSFNCTRAAPRGFTTETTICSIFGVVPGVYEADVSASNYRTGHVRVEVPEHVIQPYECCAVGYAPQRVGVALDSP